MPSDAVKMLVQAFISCRLDCCNSVFNDICDGPMTWLQSVQNAAARLVSGARRYDHITPEIHQLHWVTVRKRVNFKIATLVYRSLSGMAPAYLAADCQLSSSAAFCRLKDLSSGGPTATLGTDVSRLPAQGCRTAFQLVLKPGPQ